MKVIVSLAAFFLMVFCFPVMGSDSGSEPLPVLEEEDEVEVREKPRSLPDWFQYKDSESDEEDEVIAAQLVVYSNQVDVLSHKARWKLKFSDGTEAVGTAYPQRNKVVYDIPEQYIHESEDGSGTQYFDVQINGSKTGGMSEGILSKVFRWNHKNFSFTQRITFDSEAAHSTTQGLGERGVAVVLRTELEEEMEDESGMPVIGLTMKSFDETMFALKRRMTNDFVESPDGIDFIENHVEPANPAAALEKELGHSDKDGLLMVLFAIMAGTVMMEPEMVSQPVYEYAQSWSWR